MRLVVGEELRHLFHTFEYTAFRLEMRESYYEKEQLRQFLADEPVDLEYMRTWLALMRQLRQDGKRVERVRVVSEPHSDYTRYSLWLAQHNTRAGEDIRYLPRHQAPELADHDYWLFDSSRLYVVQFDEADNLLGAELVDDPATTIQHCYWRDAAWHYAIPYAGYVTKADERAGQPPASA